MDTPMEIVGYFLPDALKEGRSCRKFIGKVRQVDPVERKFVFFMTNERSTGKKISIDDILEIHSELADYT